MASTSGRKTAIKSSLTTSIGARSWPVLGCMMFAQVRMEHLSTPLLSAPQTAAPAYSGCTTACLLFCLIEQPWKVGLGHLCLALASFRRMAQLAAAPLKPAQIKAPTLKPLPARWPLVVPQPLRLEALQKIQAKKDRTIPRHPSSKQKLVMSKRKLAVSIVTSVEAKGNLGPAQKQYLGARCPVRGQALLLHPPVGKMCRSLWLRRASHMLALTWSGIQ
mmetsp:Transcript_9080/g.24455  ORF Transcript_9080/g.24455 Transcript_9080/m.24455 type:complete len:219 (-) Transcript_9080:498-1154(-)